MPHPLVLSREPIATALPPERAAAAIDADLTHGVRGDGWHLGVWGSRKGDSFELSLNQLWWSEVPQARGRIEPASFGSYVLYTVSPPPVGLVASQAILVLGALGALYQVYLQLFGPEVPMGGRLAGLRDTLEGIVLLVVLIALLLLVGRWQLGGQARSLDIVLRVALKPVLEPTPPSERPTG